jgi:hypothetical protein
VRQSRRKSISFSGPRALSSHVSDKPHVIKFIQTTWHQQARHRPFSAAQSATRRPLVTTVARRSALFNRAQSTVARGLSSFSGFPQLTLRPFERTLSDESEPATKTSTREPRRSRNGRRWLLDRLYRSLFVSGFHVVVTSLRLDALAQRAAAEAVRLDGHLSRRPSEGSITLPSWKWKR